MAPKLRSGRIFRKCSDSSNENTQDCTKAVAQASALDSSFVLPNPGPSTQAIIDDLAQQTSELPELDEVIEEDFLIFSPNKVNEYPNFTPQTDDVEPQESKKVSAKPKYVPLAEINVQKGRKRKQDKEKQCPVCPNTVQYLRQHLVKTHGWQGRPLKFILSVFSTQNLRSPVYECEECCCRFTHRQCHLQQFGCQNVVKVDSGQISTGSSPLHAREGCFIGAWKWNDERLCPFFVVKNWKLEFLRKVFRGTHNFKRSDLLGKCLDDLKTSKNCTFTSVRKLCFDFKFFITWMSSGNQKSYRIRRDPLEATVKLSLKEHARETQKEQSEQKIERFATVPSMKRLCEAQDLVKSFINSRLELDSEWHQLSLHEKFSLLLFQFHSRANCRVGILLNFTCEELAKYTPGEFIRSHEHKTGSIFTNFAYIKLEEKKLLQELHANYEEIYGQPPTNVFPGSNDKDLTTQASTIERLMKILFGITSYKLHPNSCRKCWDTYYIKNKQCNSRRTEKTFWVKHRTQR